MERPGTTAPPAEPDGSLYPRRVLLLLLAATVGFILLQPLAATVPTAVRVLEALMIVSAVLVCATTRRHLWIALALGVPAAVLGWLANRAALDLLNTAAAVFNSLLYLFLLVLMLQRVFRSRVVTLETLYLSVASYLMTGLVWSILYMLIELGNPGSFSCFAHGPRPEGWVSELVYFSFVTMTTLGYGDITPVAPLARSLAMLEAVTGTMFLGVLIAGLVGRLRTGAGASRSSSTATRVPKDRSNSIR